MKTKNNQSAYRAFLASKNLRPIAEKKQMTVEEAEAQERKAWLARLPLGGGDSIVWLQEENPNKQLHPRIPQVFRPKPAAAAPEKVKRAPSTRRIPLEVEAGELGVFLLEGITQENLASAVWLAREAKELNVRMPLTLTELRARVQKARDAQRKQDAKSLKESNLWADQQFSKAVARFKAMQAQGIAVDKKVVRSGLYPFPQGSRLAEAQAVLAHEGFVVLLAEDAPRSSAFVQEHDLGRWVAGIIKEVIAELERNKTVVRASERPELEEDYDSMQHTGRRYLPNGKRKFRKETPRVSKSRSGSRPVAQKAPLVSKETPVARPVAPVVVAQPVDLLATATGVSRRVW